jgi:type I restriction enzyme S subunit
LDQADTIRRKRRLGCDAVANLIPSVFSEFFGNPTTNPRGWPTCTLGNLLDHIDSGWSPPCEDRPVVDGEWGVLKLGAVTYCEYNDAENKALPAGLAARPEIEVKTGDLLFTRKNTYELVAACALVRKTRPKLLLPDLIFRLRFKQDAPAVPEYLWQLLIHPGQRAKIQKLAGGSAGSMPNISASSTEFVGEVWFGKIAKCVV